MFSLPAEFHFNKGKADFSLGVETPVFTIFIPLVGLIRTNLV